MADIDFASLMQQAQQMREQMEKMQSGLASQEVEGSAGAGMVKVKMTGDQRVVSIEIDPSVMGEDRDMLQDLMVAAVNNALERAREIAQNQLTNVIPPGMAGKIPGL